MRSAQAAHDKDVGYSARKAITLIVEVAYAGGTHTILAVLTVRLVLSA
jgi:hypothetical protein